MISDTRTLVIGTRKSALALWQTKHVKQLLEEVSPGVRIEIRKVITRGDKTQAADKPLPEIGGKGLFTAELEEELAEENIDLAVHSLKDLPTEIDQRFTLGAICERGPVADVLVSRENLTLDSLPSGGLVGTSSVRRIAQIRRLRPDLQTESIRGNVGTRIAKVHNRETQYDATILAQAGVCRLGYEEVVSQVFSQEEMLPAPGQGALAVQCRSEDRELLSALAVIDHAQTRAEVLAEREFLATLNAGCNTPVACLGRFIDGRIRFLGRCISTDGSRVIESRGEEQAEAAVELGRRMGEEALKQGFRELQ